MLHKMISEYITAKLVRDTKLSVTSLIREVVDLDSSIFTNLEYILETLGYDQNSRAEMIIFTLDMAITTARKTKDNDFLHTLMQSEAPEDVALADMIYLRDEELMHEHITQVKAHKFLTGQSYSVMRTGPSLKPHTLSFQMNKVEGEDTKFIAPDYVAISDVMDKFTFDRKVKELIAQGKIKDASEYNQYMIGFLNGIKLVGNDDNTLDNNL